MRKTLKFFHTLGGIGLLGAMASLLFLLATLPDPLEDPTSYVTVRNGMDNIARGLLLPSLGLTLVSGLFSMAAVPSYQNAGWAWLKLATGIVMFEGSLLAIQGPVQAEAELARDTLETSGDLTALGLTVSSETSSLWVLMFVAVINVALGVYRPKMKRPKPSEET